MLLQQTSKYLLKQLKANKPTQLIDLSFVYQKKTNIDLSNLRNIDTIDQLLKDSFRSKYESCLSRIVELAKKHKDPADQWNYLQPHFANSLALSYGNFLL